MKKKIIAFFALVMMVTGSVAPAAALTQGRDIKTVPIRFRAGSSSATVSGSIKGYATVDYVLRANGGQAMSVALKSRSTSVYFNILPGENKDTGEALNAEPRPVEVTNWSGELPGDGEYIIRVYQVRATARRGATAAYSLTVSIK